MSIRLILTDGHNSVDMVCSSFCCSVMLLKNNLYHLADLYDDGCNEFKVCASNLSLNVRCFLIGSVHSPLDLSEDEWNDIIKTNLKGTWLVTKYVCIRMRDAQKGGSVINVSSTAGLNRGQLPGSLIYAASKAAVNTMTKVIILMSNSVTCHMHFFTMEIKDYV